MDRAQFLEILKSQLAGKMYTARIEAHLRYYEDYIQSQVRGGRSEAEILEELGDPRLIARTLLDTDTSSGEEIYEEAYTTSGYAREDSPYGQDYDQGQTSRHAHLDLTTWYGKLIVIAIAALIIFLLVTVLTAVLPFFLILGLIMFVISRFRNR